MLFKMPPPRKMVTRRPGASSAANAVTTVAPGALTGAPALALLR
jgi:hypothetical protein